MTDTYNRPPVTFNARVPSIVFGGLKSGVRTCLAIPLSGDEFEFTGGDSIRLFETKGALYTGCTQVLKISHVADVGLSANAQVLLSIKKIPPSIEMTVGVDLEVKGAGAVVLAAKRLIREADGQDLNLEPSLNLLRSALKKCEPISAKASIDLSRSPGTKAPDQIFTTDGVDYREILERTRALVHRVEGCEDCDGKIGLATLREALSMPSVELESVSIVSQSEILDGDRDEGIPFKVTTDAAGPPIELLEGVVSAINDLVHAEGNGHSRKISLATTRLEELRDGLEEGILNFKSAWVEAGKAKLRETYREVFKPVEEHRAPNPAPQSETVHEWKEEPLHDADPFGDRERIAEVLAAVEEVVECNENGCIHEEEWTRAMTRLEEAKKALEVNLPGAILSGTPWPSEALNAFMGWLTSRDAVSGPFSSRHNAGQAAELVGEYCKIQNWADPRARWGDLITRPPTDPECTGCGHPESSHDKEHMEELCSGFIDDGPRYPKPAEGRGQLLVDKAAKTISNARDLLLLAEEECEDVDRVKLRAALAMPALKGTRIKVSGGTIDFEEVDALRQVATSAEEFLLVSEAAIPRGQRSMFARLRRAAALLELARHPELRATCRFCKKDCSLGYQSVREMFHDKVRDEVYSGQPEYTRCHPLCDEAKAAGEEE